MTGLVQVLGVLFGVMVVVVGIAESFFIHDQRLHRFFLVDPQDLDTVRLWTFNQGFYNIVWGIGAITGSLLLTTAGASEGRTLLLFTCVAHVILGTVLFVSERRLWASALAQGLFPLVIAVLLLL